MSELSDLARFGLVRGMLPYLMSFSFKLYFKLGHLTVIED